MINNKNLLVYPWFYSNDGMALKHGIEFDGVSNTNVGLSVTVDIDFIKANTPPQPKMLSDLLITEVMVRSITSLNNKMSLPVSVVYSIKSAKSGGNLTKLFTDYIKILQMCETCTKLAKSDDLIINDSSFCCSYCEPCFASNRIYDKCKEIGHFHIHCALSFCKKCLSLKQQCKRRTFFGITTNCKEGKKNVFNNEKEN